MEEGSEDLVVDEDFLSQIEEAELKALSVKRRKISRDPERYEEEEVEGVYTAAVRGTGAFLTRRHHTAPTGSGTLLLRDGDGGNNNNACFKCGQLGHWSRDCTNSAPPGASNGVPDKPCSCGLGICLLLVANTEKNRGRKFYRCPVRQENGGCGFFEWCDNSSTPNSANTPSYIPNSSFPDVPCPCGAGSCLTLTAKTGKNIGQQFYRCPANQENACGFFKWCTEYASAVGLQTKTSKVTKLNDANNRSYSEMRGSSCFKCGQEGHWARDCPSPSSASNFDAGGRSASSGTC